MKLAYDAYKYEMEIIDMGDAFTIEADSFVPYALAVKRLVGIHNHMADEARLTNTLSSLTVQHFIEAGDVVIVEFGKLANLLSPLLDTEA